MKNSLIQTNQEDKTEGIHSQEQGGEPSSSTVPIEIRNLPGLQLVVHLYENKEECNYINQENDISDSLQGA